MLIDLKVSNFAIIENLEIKFSKGLNILSGETGAGKSVLLKSLSLLMGLKSSSESIRTDCSQASIEGSFDLSKRKDLKAKLLEMGIECEEDLLIVRRLISEDKSRVYLNGTLSTLQNLRDVVAPLIEVAGHSAPLIEMTGQHENRHLLSTAYHMDLLDQYAGAWEKRHQFENLFQQAQVIENQINKIQSSSQNKEQRLDFLKFQRQEISELDLQPGEESVMEQNLKKLKSSSKVIQFVESVEIALCEDADSCISRLQSILNKGKDLTVQDPQLSEKMAQLQQSKLMIEDAVYSLRQYVEQIDADPKTLENLESRLSLLRKVQKKYGQTADEILAALIRIESEIAQYENVDETLQNLNKELEKMKLQLSKRAQELHKIRAEAAILLENSVNSELLDLNMKGVTFHVRVDLKTQYDSTGTSEIEFMSKTSAKDPKRPLAKFASGGELSRILLSLKRVIGTTQHPRTYLFDEVDTGVSGTTAEKVGKKLKSIAKGQQVICVTHLPQVAAFGDHHFIIQKSPQKDQVNMEVLELNKKERIQEIARLISGEKITKTSLAHAEQLLQEAH
jgi:DNA repair protein RecN (Recombination protein N)